VVGAHSFYEVYNATTGTLVSQSCFPPEGMEGIGTLGQAVDSAAEVDVTNVGGCEGQATFLVNYASRTYVLCYMPRDDVAQFLGQRFVTSTLVV